MKLLAFLLWLLIGVVVACCFLFDDKEFLWQ
jgi:hypothetical protein